MPGVAIPANVVSVAVCKEIVCGRLDFAWIGETGWYLEEDPPRSGYFLLDTRNDRAKTGLSKEEWLERLADLGIKEEPVLKAPSREFTY